MIDFIKFEVLNKTLFEHNLETKTDMEILKKYDILSGVELIYPKRGKLKNIDISISEKKAYISGSIHKFSNMYGGGDEQNYNDFSYCEFKYAINKLCNDLHINSKETKITNLEFGFNLEVNENPKYLIEDNLLMFDFKDHNRNQKFGGRGDFKEFEKSDYSIKVYNKSKQSKIIGKNILRIELKISKPRYLEKFGIWNLEDLNEQSFEILHKDFLKNFEKLIIIDSSTPCNRPRTDDEIYLVYWKNPNNWNTIRKTESYSEQLKVKSRFLRTLRKYFLLSTKNELRELINNKFTLLMNCNDYKLLQSNH